MEFRAVSCLLSNPLGLDVLRLSIFWYVVKDISGQEQRIDGITNEAITVAWSVGSLTNHPQETPMTIHVSGE